MKRLLIVVDYQNDFVNGSLGFEGAELLDERIADKIREYRNNGDDVCFTMDTHYDDYMDTMEGKKLPVVHCIKDTHGWELYGETAKLKMEEDMCFIKNTFPSLELGKWLEDKEYSSVELVGLVSNICVLSNAVMVKAALPDAEIIVDAKCTSAADIDMNNKALDVMAGIHVNIVNIL